MQERDRMDRLFDEGQELGALEAEDGTQVRGRVLYYGIPPTNPRARPRVRVSAEDGRQWWSTEAKLMRLVDDVEAERIAERLGWLRAV